MPSRKIDFFVIAHNIRSLYNVGSVFRTADAFGVSRVYLTGITGTPQELKHKQKIAKSALGAESFVPWEYHKSAVKLIKHLQSLGVKLIGLENNVRAKRLQGTRFKSPVALLLGEETKGIPKPILKLCDEVVEIPMVGEKESLNVAVAFGIAAYKIAQDLKI
jgi:tRNA G18 (ribose-2'-O)-methylase SpoU